MNYSDADKTYAWLDELFETNTRVPGSKIAHPEALRFPDGLPSTEEQTKERETVYSFDAIQNAYRVLWACSMADDRSHSESLLHAHAESFLKRAYAAWHLVGDTRDAFEKSLKSYVNITLNDLFTSHAPICRVGTNEILALQDMHSEMETLRSENAVLRGEIERRDDALAELRTKLGDAELRDRRFNETLADSIAGAKLQQQNEYNYLKEHVDTVVSAATMELQQQNQTVLRQLGECQFDLSKVAKQIEGESSTVREQNRLLALAQAEMKKMQERLEACGEPKADESCSIM
jgi:hypothetical protein